MKKLTAYLLMVCSVTLTLSAIAQDSVKSSNSDMRVLLKEHENYPRLQAIADSNARQYSNCQNDKTLLRQELVSCNTINSTQQQLIASDSTQTTELKKELHQANRWLVIWRAVADITGIAAATEGVVIYGRR